MSDHTRPKDLFPKTDDDKGVHVEAETGDSLPVGQAGGSVDFDQAHTDGVVVELEGGVVVLFDLSGGLESVGRL